MIQVAISILSYLTLTLILAGSFLWPPFDQLQWGPNVTFINNFQPIRVLIIVFMLLTIALFLFRKSKRNGFLTLISLVSLVLLETLPSQNSLVLLVQLVMPMFSTFVLASDPKIFKIMEKSIIPIIVTLGTIDAFTGFAEYFNPDFLGFIHGVPWKQGMGLAYGKVARMAGIQYHPVVFGAMMLAPSILSFQMLLTNKKPRQFILYAFALIASLTALFLSYSRGAWLSFGVAVLIIVLKHLKTNPYKVGIFVAVALVTVWILKEPILTRFGVLWGSSSFSHRAFMYKWAFDNLSEKMSFFFGRKIDILEILRASPPPDKLLTIDNIYLSALLQYGLVGLVLILTILLGAVMRERNSFGALRWALFALMLDGLTFDILYWQCTTVLIAILAGMLWTTET